MYDLLYLSYTGNPMAQQYITIPVSLGMGSAQPIQILANPPIMAGLQQFAMIPSQVGTTPDANVSKSMNACKLLVYKHIATNTYRL